MDLKKKYADVLEKMLTPERLNHSYCVADQAKHLAKIYKFDEEKAELAGLLHDITKSLSVPEHLRIIEEAGVELDNIQKTSTKFLHSISGAIYVKKYLDVNDEDVISAIRYHTTAKPNMMLLEQIIYLADFTSADRKFIDAGYMREMAENSLIDGIRFGLVYTIRDLLNKSSKIHPDTFYAYNYYQNQINYMFY